MEGKDLEKIIAAFENSEYYKFWGLNIDRLENGLCNLSLSLINIHDINGNTSAGVYSSICDFSSRLACYSILPPFMVPEILTTNLSVCIPCNCQSITVHSKVLQTNECFCYINSDIYNENNELVAAGRNILQIMK